MDQWEKEAILQTSEEIVETQRTIVRAMGHVLRLNQVHAKLLGNVALEPEYAVDI